MDVDAEVKGARGSVRSGPYLVGQLGWLVWVSTTLHIFALRMHFKHLNVQISF